MALLDTALAELERARSLRAAAEARAGAVWNDVVFHDLEKRQLDPLEIEESRYLSTVRELGASLDRCMARLRNS
ncbi:MAG TPA: hypothetical protein VNR62_04145 [Cellulomonas sp.]|nr:hypothetical protein [Cellulomonas sp.]